MLQCNEQYLLFFTILFLCKLTFTIIYYFIFMQNFMQNKIHNNLPIGILHFIWILNTQKRCEPPKQKHYLFFLLNVRQNANPNRL